MANYDGEIRIELIDRALLRKNAELQAFLDARPINFGEDDIAKLRGAHEIDARKTELVASRSGWRPSGKSFAWPGIIIKDGDRTLSFACEARGLLERNLASRGDLDQWLSDVCPAIAKSSFAIFAQGVVYAAPLQRFSRAPEGALFAFTGKSGSGKTGICVAAQAVMGNPDRQLMPSWDMTEAGARDFLAEVRHFAAIIDDTSRDGRTNAQRLAFSSYLGHILSGGGGKRRAKAYEAAQGPAVAREPALGLTSGEVSPDELAALTGDSVLGGARVRFIDIPVPPPAKGGVFDQIFVGKAGGKTVGAGRRAAKDLERAVEECHGVAFPIYLDHLTSNVDGLEAKVRRIEARFVRVQEKRRRGASSSDLRIAEKFGLVLAGLEQAIEAGVLPLTHKQAKRSVRLCFKAVMKGQDCQRRLLSRKIRQLRKVLGDPIQAPVMATGPADAANVAFRRFENGRYVAYMKLEKLGPLLNLDADGVDRLLREMLRRRRIERGIGDVFTRPVPFPGRRSIPHLVFTDAMLKSGAANPAPPTLKGPEEPPARMVKNVLGEMVAPPTLTPSGRRRRPRRARWPGGRAR
jgi:hypothetical protein